MQHDLPEIHGEVGTRVEADIQGVDQGINVSNRARKLSVLLGDEARIRQERRKAKTNAKKFGAVSSNTYSSGSASRRAGPTGPTFLMATPTRPEYSATAAFTGVDWAILLLNSSWLF